MIAVFGSINIDIVYSVPHIVKQGETISSTRQELHAGGKGANQSVAAQRAGGKVSHIGCIAQDGVWIKTLMEQQGINTDGITVLQEKTGTGNAIIQVAADSKDNAIVLFPGGNHRNQLNHFVIQLKDQTGWVMFQNETNIIKEAMQKAHESKLMVAFNPAPMSSELITYPLQVVSLLILNQVEAQSLAQQLGFTGADLLSKIVEQLQSDVLMGVVITLGKDGVSSKFKIDGQWEQFDVEAPKVDVVDTTGAGDTFCGYLVSLLAQNGTSRDSIKHALSLATKAGSLACTKQGAIPSIPYIKQL